jgi:prepilin-type processing-associated H-X9-DG protein
VNQQERFGTGAAKERRPMSYGGISGSYYSRTGQCSGGKKVKGVYCVGTAGNPNNYDGMFIQGWPVALKSVTDGTSKTLLIGERWYQQRAWTIGAYWTTRDSGEPYNPRQNPPPAPTGPQPGAANFSFKNVTDLAPLNLELYSKCYVIHDNATDRPQLPDSCKSPGININDLPWASFHPSGVNFSFADASIRFLPDDIDMDIFRSLASRNGDETVPEYE